MSWDPHKPLDEQPDRLFRYAPWAFLGAAVLIPALLLVF